MLVRVLRCCILIFFIFFLLSLLFIFFFFLFLHHFLFFLISFFLFFFFFFFFFFNDTATTEIYTLSLHDALPILVLVEQFRIGALDKSPVPWLLEIVAGLIDTDEEPAEVARREAREEAEDRKSTRLNSSHVRISYAVFCLKKKKKKKKNKTRIN